jgi:putative ABC transport system permease protein
VKVREHLNPRICGLRVDVLIGMYRRRLRHHAVREVLAGGGIAVGVALVFGVLVANSSVLGSARDIIHSVDGSASLELAARSPQGFSQGLAEEVQRIPGVRDAALLLRENAVIVGPRGSRSVQLVGVTPKLISLRGSVTRNLGPGTGLLSGGIGLPAGIAETIGAQAGGAVTLLTGGAAHTSRVGAVLDAGAIGPLASSGLVVALLPQAQHIAGTPHRVTEVLVRVAPGEEGPVARGLRLLAAGRLDVLPANAELNLLNETAKPTSQSSDLFAAIGLMVGFLLALNAMLLIVPERRREIAEMRSQGYDAKQVLVLFGFQAVTLGVVASLVGVVVGNLLARTLFANAPIYLSVAFPISGQQIIGTTTVLAAIGLGVAATLAASLMPIMLDLTSKEPVDAVLKRRGEAGQQISTKLIRRLAVAGAVITVCVTIAAVTVPSSAVIGGVALALASLCFIPLIFRLAANMLRRIARRYGGMVAVAAIELNAGAMRAVALAGVAALAVYGVTAVNGAQRDLTHGLNRTFAEYIGTADIWVTARGNNLTVNNFSIDGSVAAIAGAPGVASVRTDQGEYLDVGSRRMWVIARPATGRSMLPVGQLLEGRIVSATNRLRQYGWAGISSTFAAEHDLHIGGAFSLPTPSGRASFRVAAITTNIGWPPGTVTLNTADYARYWQTSEPTALEVDLKPGVNPTRGKREVQAVLLGRPGLRVQTRNERIAQFQGNASQGLHSISEISILLLLTAALALAAALSTVIYQRRAQFVALKEDGFDHWQLWRGFLIEASVLLSIGCADGAILGIYGHALANRYLRLSTGFPAPFSLGPLQLVLTLLIVAGVSLAVIALPGYTAAGVPITRLDLRE